jgi:hypothetical protein
VRLPRTGSYEFGRAGLGSVPLQVNEEASKLIATGSVAGRQVKPSDQRDTLIAHETPRWSGNENQILRRRFCSARSGNLVET